MKTAALMRVTYRMTERVAGTGQGTANIGARQDRRRAPEDRGREALNK